MTDIEEAVSRLTAWMGADGSGSSKVFLDDLAVVLSVALESVRLKAEWRRLRAELSEARKTMSQFYAMGDISAFDYERLVEWIKNPERKEPMFAFTAGSARTAAIAVERSGILAELSEARKEIERLKR